MGTWKECVFWCCWVKCSTRVHEILLVDGVHASLLLIFCILILLITKWEESWPPQLQLWSCSFLLSLMSVFASSILKLLFAIRIAISSWLLDLLLIMLCPFLFAPDVWYIFFHPFTFNLLISLTWSECLMQSYFLIHNLCLWTVFRLLTFNTFTNNAIIDF